MKIVPVILSGGSGTRLWPLSRKQYPKQYLPLASDNTMREFLYAVDLTEGLNKI
jgi:mannose-1-phosphate guanylyltransferase / mannose-6-phosphate isomerase